MAAFFMRPQIIGLPIRFRLLPPGHSSIATAAPPLRQEKVGAYNWDFASGKSQTICPWHSWEKTGTGGAPRLWFHHAFRGNGDPCDAGEVTLIRNLARPLHCPPGGGN
jgi:hypothetical protein